MTNFSQANPPTASLKYRTSTISKREEGGKEEGWKAGREGGREEEREGGRKEREGGKEERKDERREGGRREREVEEKDRKNSALPEYLIFNFRKSKGFITTAGLCPWFYLDF